MERFVQLIVGGGGALVGALWLVDLAARGSTLWFVGIVLAALGLLGVLTGIAGELEL